MREHLLINPELERVCNEKCKALSLNINTSSCERERERDCHLTNSHQVPPHRLPHFRFSRQQREGGGKGGRGHMHLRESWPQYLCANHHPTTSNQTSAHPTTPWRTSTPPPPGQPVTLTGILTGERERKGVHRAIYESIPINISTRIYEDIPMNISTSSHLREYSYEYKYSHLPEYSYEYKYSHPREYSYEY